MPPVVCAVPASVHGSEFGGMAERRGCWRSLTTAVMSASCIPASLATRTSTIRHESDDWMKCRSKLLPRPSKGAQVASMRGLGRNFRFVQDGEQILHKAIPLSADYGLPGGG